MVDDESDIDDDELDNKLDELLSYIFDIQKYTPPMDVFMDSILDLEHLIGDVKESRYPDKHYQLLYANVITILETYLSDSFIPLVLKHETFKRDLIKNTGLFDKKYTLGEIYDEKCDIDKIILKKLFKVIWHNIGEVKKLYQVLEVDFPNDLDFLHKAINNRHDIVHRNGKNFDGLNVNITKKDVEHLKQETEGFVDNINSQLMKIIKAL